MDINTYFEDVPSDSRYPQVRKRFKNGGFLVTCDAVANPNIWADIQTNFEAKEDDIYVVSFPRTGTTWTQEMVYLIGSNCDFDSARNTISTKRFPYLEFPNSKLVDESPRFIKSHYPYVMLPETIFKKKCKVIYVARNPKDTAVSYYHFQSNFTGNAYEGDLKTYVDLFVEDALTYMPFSKHVLGFWEKRNESNICFLQYEDMKKDLPSSIRRIASFLDKTLTDDQVNQIAEHCQVENMKKNPSVNRKHLGESKYFKPSMQFIRKGTVGDWKNHFTPEINEKMEKYIKERFGSTGLEFTYEL